MANTSRASIDPFLSAYSGLHNSSLAVALAPITRDDQHLNLLVPSISPDTIFAGIKTAVEAAIVLGEALRLPLRFIAMHESGSETSYAETFDFLITTFEIKAAQLTLRSRAGLLAEGFGADDFWLATYWTTAHALDVACKVGIVTPARVIYLVQDYEPGFFPWSSESSIARSTYDAGFVLVVNSLPLRNYLARETEIEVSEAFVFAPHFDTASMREVAAVRIARGSRPIPRIFFYGRPGKPRNLYSVGLAALRIAVAILAAEGIAVEVVSAGLPHDDIDLGHDTVMKSRGRLDWAGYCDLLASIDVGLSLQMSAHPSHPPLEVAMSGAWAVSNEFADTRGSLHARLLVRRAEASALAEGLVQAVKKALDSGPGTFAEPELSLLGGDFDAVLQRTAEGLLP